MSKMINIPGRLHAVTSENVVAGSNEILDDTIGKKQNVINKEVDNKLVSLETEVASKQKTLTAGVGITIAPDGTISTIADRSIGKIVEDHTAISSPVEGLLYLEQTETQGTYAQYVYNNDTWTSLGNITLSFGLDDVPTAGSENVAKSGGTKQYVDINTSKEDENIFDSSIFVNNGFVRPDGTISSGNGYMYSNKLDISKYSILKLIIRVASSSVSPAVFYDENEDYISGITATSGISQVDTMYIDVPTNAKYVVISGASSYFSSFAISGLYNINKYINNFTNDLINSIESLEEIYALQFTNYRNKGYYRPNGTFIEHVNYRYSEYIDISNYTTLYVHSQIGSASISPAVFFDSELNFISGITSTVVTETDYEITVPENAKYVSFSSVYSKVNIFKASGKGNLTKTIKANTIYISVEGVDTNSGLTENSPIYSFTAAKNKLKRNGTLIFLEGEYENYELDLSWFDNIVGKGNVKFVNYLQKITEGTPVDGYTKVLSTALTSPFAVSSQGVIYHRYFYQHNINDAATLIASGEVHPLHRGKTHRLPSTRVYKVNSIAEVESSDIPAFYYDHSTTTIYFSKVEDSSLETNPIIIPHMKPYTATEKNSVYIDNIKVLYKNILTTYMYGILSNVSVGMCYGAGAFRLDNTKGLQLINCEAYACENDGFNTHNSNLSVTKSSEITLIDCYGHDNGDDGESAHESSLITQHGGLYEYNGNGCTPASGATGIYYNVLVRNNGDHAWVIDNMGTGFSCQGSASGNSYMECYSCVSENNNYGFRNTAGRGHATIYDCIASDNTVDFLNVIIRKNLNINEADFNNMYDSLLYQENIYEDYAYNAEGYWIYNRDDETIYFNAVSGWHCTNPIPCVAGDKFVINSTILVGTSVHALYDSNKNFIGLAQDYGTQSLTTFVITQEQYTSGVRYISFSFRPADTPAILKEKFFSSQENERRLSNLEASVNNDITIFNNIKPNYAFAHAAPLVFRNKLNSIDHDMQVLLFGDSITAYTHVVSTDEEPDAANRPCGMQRNGLTWLLWNSLCNNKPQCDRFDSTINPITESNDNWQLSNYKKFNNAVEGEIHYNPITSNGNVGEFSQDNSVYRECNATDAYITFDWDLDTYENLAFIHRLGCDGTTAVQINCTEGKVEVYDEDTDAWVEANSYEFSQFIQYISPSAGGSSCWIRQKILKLRKATNGSGVITLTFTNATGDGYMYYWGTERWNGNTLRIINLGKGGRSSNLQLYTIHDEIAYRHPDLIIYQLPVWNELKTGGSYTETWNIYHRQVIDLIKAQSDNWNNYQMMIYIPHTQAADWDKDRNKRFQANGLPDRPLTNEVSMTELTREELLLSGYDLNVPILNLNSLIIDFAHSLGIDMQTFLGSISDAITDGTTAEVNVTDKYTADGVHMSKTGAKFVANCLLPMLK